ncbi:TIGR02147 family protein [Fibrobacter sp. UWB11]|uniref:TIGR02147 family protein n=1 Tax=Fibrobacter sp. UWB11 TaxID=1896202 RepID=UPI00092A2D7F|nr:TIGR02147 family protein [Fibrobacter sp. UWB11]SIO16400.1 TIGR02147 family protein [Fibrobacter sp. UWB11]
MKPITEYKDYRLYMQDFYEERKRTSAFSWREFSKLAGFKSPVYLKLVCEGKSSLSLVKMDQVAHAMGLVGHEFAYFTQMVKFGNATKDSVKKEALLEMQKIAREHKVRVVDAEAFRFYDSWKNPTIRELAPMMPGKRPLEMAKTCHQVISAEQVRDSLAFLVQTGFLKREAEHTYVQTEKTVIGSKESVPIAIRAMHKEMASLARMAIDKFPSEERHITGVTLGLCEEAYARISQEMDVFIRKAVSIAAEYENLNQVYRLNLQLFPLTKKVEEESHE